MQFEYTDFGHERMRPLVDVVVSAGERDCSYTLLVDSGADINVLSAEVARALGLRLEDGERLDISGATGSAETFWRHQVTLIVGGHELLVTAAFGEGKQFEPSGLAGQEGFFDQFEVTFDRRAGLFELDPKVDDASAHDVTG